MAASLTTLIKTYKKNQDALNINDIENYLDTIDKTTTTFPQEKIKNHQQRNKTKFHSKYPKIKNQR